MSENAPRLERFLEGAARLASGAGLHPLIVLQEVQAAATASIQDGSMANAYRVLLAKSDLEALGSGDAQLRDAIRRLLDEVRGSRNARITAPWQIELTEDQRARAGSLRVEAHFRNAPHAGRAAPAGVTEVVTRQRGRRIVVEGVGQVALTHTPFTIGREAGCDLVIVDMAISRRHARIESSPAGELVLRDLGSRNKLVVDGAAHDEVLLRPEGRVLLGGTNIWLEEDA
jgi:hypothetical protein